MMKQAAALGGALLLTGAVPEDLAATATQSVRHDPRCIDVHHHILPPEYVGRIGPSVIGAPAGRSDAPTELQRENALALFPRFASA